MPPSGHARILFREDVGVPPPPKKKNSKSCVCWGWEDFQRKGHRTLSSFRNNGYQYFIEHLVFLCTVFCSSHSSHLILMVSLSETHCHAHFIDEKNEVQRQKSFVQGLWPK